MTQTCATHQSVTIEFRRFVARDDAAIKKGLRKCRVHEARAALPGFCYAAAPRLLDVRASSRNRGGRMSRKSWRWNCEDFYRHGNRVGLPGLPGGAEGIRTSDLRDKARGVGRRFQGLKLPKRRLRISLETSGVSLDLRAASSSKASPVSMRTAGLPVATWYRRTITST
jgi:hypothetical protein